MTQSDDFNTLGSLPTTSQLSSEASEPGKSRAVITPPTLPTALTAQKHGAALDELFTTEEDPHMAIFLMLEESLEPMRVFVLIQQGKSEDRFGWCREVTEV
jgi:hypothetical protein